MDMRCPFCHAWHWDAERLANSSALHPRFGTCCKSGNVKLPLVEKLPIELERLFNGTDHDSKHFLENI
jgi:hypothetical protein